METPASRPVLRKIPGDQEYVKSHPPNIFTSSPNDLAMQEENGDQSKAINVEDDDQWLGNLETQNDIVMVLASADQPIELDN